MNTTYNPGDRVITKVKGVETEVSIVKLTVDIEVKADDGKTYWRAIGKVRPVGDGAAQPQNAEPPSPVAQVPPVPVHTPLPPTPVEPSEPVQPETPLEEQPGAGAEATATPAEEPAEGNAQETAPTAKKARKPRKWNW